MTEILNVRWFSGRDCVGAVLIRVGNKTAAYIGLADGVDEQRDIKDIRDFGARLPYNVASAMFPGVEEREYSEESI